MQRAMTRTLAVAALVLAGQGLWAVGAVADSPLTTIDPSGAMITYEPVLVVGDPSGTPSDLPSYHVDANVSTSLYAGVGSIYSVSDLGLATLGTGTLIGSRYVLTAAHLFDTNNDGQNDFPLSGISFILNDSGNQSHTIGVSALDIHPDFDGFNNPLGTVNDDLAILTLAEDAPTGVPVYDLWPDEITTIQTITLVGYGRSGNGVAGFTIGASKTVKRVGWNQLDAHFLDDEGSGAFEVWEGDFDDPTGAGSNYLGGESLGNALEVTLGHGDSGGPTFIQDGDGYLYLVGNNTFLVSFSGGPSAPKFDSGLGGILLYPYLGWIDSVVPEPATMALLALGAGLVLARRRRR